MTAMTDQNAHLSPFPSAAGTPRSRTIERGEGVRVYNTDGDGFIDAAAALWCMNVGYGREEIAEAMAAQATRLPFFHSFAAFYNEPSERLAERISSLAPSGIRKVFFGLSGSDANDSAAKVVWQYNNLLGRPKKKKIISRKGNYHGTGVIGASLSGIGYMHDDFDLPLPGFLKVSETDCYRLAELHPNSSEEQYSDVLAQEVERVILSEGPDTIAAFVVEPIMTNAGVRVPPRGYFEALQKVLEQYDVLLWVDEVVSGFGRMGDWFGSQYFDLKPDLISTAKGLTSGYCPMSALLLGEKISRTLDKKAGGFCHGYTYSAHPVAAATSNAVLDIIERENLLANVSKIGPYLIQTICARLQDNHFVGDVRGAGLLCGVELVQDRDSKQSFAPEVNAAAMAADFCYEEGVILRGLSVLGRDCLAFSPPFIFSEDDVDELADRVARGLKKFADRVDNETR